MTTLNDIIADTDNEIGRLRLGKDISRPRKKKNVLLEERRETCKEKLRSGAYTPWQYLQTISHTVGIVVTFELFAQQLGYSCLADTLTAALPAVKNRRTRTTLSSLLSWNRKQIKDIYLIIPTINYLLTITIYHSLFINHYFHSLIIIHYLSIIIYQSLSTNTISSLKIESIY